MESKLDIVHKKGDLMPLRGLPETTLNQKVLDLSEWLCQLLAVKPDDKNVARLEVLLPMVKDYCWSMSISEIKTAFNKYVRNELPGLEPVDNYLTAILFGKVIKAYKEQRPVKIKKLEPPQMSQEEKDAIVFMGLVNCFDDYVQSKRIIPGYTWVYGDLEQRGLLKFTTEQKREKMRIAKVNAKRAAGDITDMFKAKQYMAEIEKKNSPPIVNEAKRLLTGDYFDALIKEKIHIKEVL